MLLEPEKEKEKSDVKIVQMCGSFTPINEIARQLILWSLLKAVSTELRSDGGSFSLLPIGRGEKITPNA